jgi:DNA repair photolyase
MDVFADRSCADVSVTFSVPTVDYDVWRMTGPHRPTPTATVAKERTGGIRAGVGMAPILPGLSDHPSQLGRVVEAVREAGPCGIWATCHLRPGTREHLLSGLARDSELLPEHERPYAAARTYRRTRLACKRRSSAPRVRTGSAIAVGAAAAAGAR